MNIKEDIKKLTQKNMISSKAWVLMTKELQYYLENEDLNLFRINRIRPHVFIWPEDSIQNKHQLNFFSKNKNSIFYRTIISSNDYGPLCINLYNNVQLDRVAQVWSIYLLSEHLKLDLNNDNEIIFEFGGGTGQMADVLKTLGFKGKHIVYDLPLMTILQRYFVNERNIDTKYLLDNEDIKLIDGANYLPCNQNDTEKKIVNFDNINFIATYSLTETDLETHNKFAEYITKFKRILIIYCPEPIAGFDNIDNEKYIHQLFKKIENTHQCYFNSNFSDSKIFSAFKK